MYHVIPDLDAKGLEDALNGLPADAKIIEIVYISGAGWYTLVVWVA